MAARSGDLSPALLNNKHISKQANSSGTSLQQLREESETEQENDLEPASKTLPFVFSMYITAYETSSYRSFFFRLLKPVQPIYLSVGNFRI